MKKTTLLAFLILILPIVVGQNITTTTGQLPINYTLNLDINGLNSNDTIYLGSDDWITLETNTFYLTENDTNYSFTAIITIPLTEEGNYTRKIYYNATGFSNFEIPIEIEIMNDSDIYENFLESESQKYLDCIIRKIKENSDTNNSTKRMKAEYECRYEVTNNPNGTIVIQEKTIIDEKPVIDSDSITKIGTIETTTTGLGSKIDTLTTDLASFKTDVLNKITNVESQVNNTVIENITTNTGTIIGIGLGILFLAAIVFGVFYIARNRKPTEKFEQQKETREEPKKGFLRKKEPKSEFDKLE